MVMKKCARAGLWAAAALAMVVTPGLIRADTTTERPGSILILPKVVADGLRDTEIEITNTSNVMTHAHCFYVNGAPLDPSQPLGPNNPPVWQETDFFIWLTRQHPTHWAAGVGRRVDPFDGLASAGAGLDPGFVPPAPSGFTGELICVQVDASGQPTAGNALAAVATVEGPGQDVVKYNAIAVLGNSPNSDAELKLDGSEYNECPEALLFNHMAQGAEDVVLGPGSVASGRLTLVPCTQNFEEQLPSRVSVRVKSCDELEACASGDVIVDCWFDRTLDLAAPGNPGLFSSTFGPFKYSRLTPNPVCNGGPLDGTPCNPETGDPDCSPGTCDRFVGLLGVYEETHTDAAGNSARTVQNLHTTMETTSGAVITLVGN